jgi:hypothetical protein
MAFVFEIFKKRRPDIIEASHGRLSIEKARVNHGLSPAQQSVHIGNHLAKQKGRLKETAFLEIW